MLVDWKNLVNNSMKAFGELIKGNPKIGEAMKALDDAGSAHGALDAKTRELIALAVAASTRCDTCIGVHAKAAAAAGATREELLEALAVAVGLNAGAAFVYSARILEAFDAEK
ncbi:carboxymuconolactone decarboxylase family protein [Fundidesulfovibrio soli]|uniref:carboxymuconolactone decarboxylase family protein n=1 Tax=Fundidesulfovibrio soli TaxID=2922716 RepID=UPI001FAFCD37|nr:carboxymuconolactone decarboxylase family protein [Fundidesulfovibrio soli]